MIAATESDDRQVNVHSPEVPPTIRDAVLALMKPGDTLWRCPCSTDRKRWFRASRGEVVIEWWLMGASGELIEAFWEA
jgi:hypothetical protein